MVQDQGVATISCYVVIIYVTLIMPNHNSRMLGGVEKGGRVIENGKNVYLMVMD